MRILIRLAGGPYPQFLMELFKPGQIKKMNCLVGKGSYRDAMLVAISKGKFIGEAGGDRNGRLEADLILSEDSSHRKVALEK